MKASFEGVSVIVTDAARGTGVAVTRTFPDAGASGILAVAQGEAGQRDACAPFAAHVVSFSASEPPG